MKTGEFNVYRVDQILIKEVCCGSDKWQEIVVKNSDGGSIVMILFRGKRHLVKKTMPEVIFEKSNELEPA